MADHELIERLRIAIQAEQAACLAVFQAHAEVQRVSEVYAAARRVAAHARRDLHACCGAEEEWPLTSPQPTHVSLVDRVLGPIFE